MARRIVRQDFRTGRQKNLALKLAAREALGKQPAEIAEIARRNGLLPRELDRHLRKPTRINLK